MRNIEKTSLYDFINFLLSRLLSELYYLVSIPTYIVLVRINEIVKPRSGYAVIYCPFIRDRPWEFQERV